MAIILNIIILDYNLLIGLKGKYAVLICHYFGRLDSIDSCFPKTTEMIRYMSDPESCICSLYIMNNFCKIL